MTTSPAEKSQIAYARLAGFMYLFVDIAYAVSILITGRFVVPGDFAATAQKIVASELVYRLGISFTLAGALCTVLLAMGLYGALKPVDKDLALLAFSFRLAEGILFGLQTIFSFAMVKLYAGNITAFDAHQLAVFTALRSAAGSAGFNVAAIFFSIGSIVFFYLFRKTDYIPRFFANLGFYGSMLVPVVCFATLLLPRYATFFQIGWVPVGGAEILAGFWMMVKGLNLRPRQSGYAVAA